MKKEVLMILSVAVTMLLALSFISAQDTCESLGYECGTWSEDLDCGSCDFGYACIVGECYDVNELGECVSIGEKYSGKKFTCENIIFSPQIEGGDEYKREYCEKKGGCEWNAENPLTCEGIPLSCSSLNEKCLTGFDWRCEWENSREYATVLSWDGEGVSWIEGKKILSDTDRLVLFMDDNIKNLENIEIHLFLTLKNSRLPEGTELMFEVYTRERGVQEPIKITDNILRGTIDEKGEAIVSWNLTDTDLAKMNFDGTSGLFFQVKKDGELGLVYHAGSSMIGETVKEVVEQDNLLLFAKTGECSGTIPCEIFSKKWECGGVSKDYDCEWVGDSCVGNGISCGGVIGDKETCKIYDCSWKWDSFWIMFKTWWLENFFS